MIHQPKTFDESRNDNPIKWVEIDAVTRVKDQGQGQCGSYWAFSATGAFECAHFIATGCLESFSEQQFVSCSHYSTYGCNGG